MLIYFPFFLSVIAIAVSVSALIWQKKSEKFRGTRDFNLSWVGFNEALLNDEDFIEFEMELHPYGELDRLGVKKMYFYFLRFNNVYSTFRGEGDVHSPLAISAMNTEANISFKDQEFIRQHVFERGYDREFSKHIEELWKQINETGTTLPMYGDEKFSTLARIK